MFLTNQQVLEAIPGMGVLQEPEAEGLLKWKFGRIEEALRREAVALEKAIRAVQAQYIKRDAEGRQIPPSPATLEELSKALEPLLSAEVEILMPELLESDITGLGKFKGSIVGVFPLIKKKD